MRIEQFSCAFYNNCIYSQNYRDHWADNEVPEVYLTRSFLIYSHGFVQFVCNFLLFSHHCDLISCRITIGWFIRGMAGILAVLGEKFD